MKFEKSSTGVFFFLQHLPGCPWILFKRTIITAGNSIFWVSNVVCIVFAYLFPKKYLIFFSIKPIDIFFLGETNGGIWTKRLRGSNACGTNQPSQAGSSDGSMKRQGFRSHRSTVGSGCQVIFVVMSPHRRWWLEIYDGLDGLFVNHD